MFDMLRHSRRAYVHERISQTDDAIANDDGGVNNVTIIGRGDDHRDGGTVHDDDGPRHPSSATIAPPADGGAGIVDFDPIASSTSTSSSASSNSLVARDGNDDVIRDSLPSSPDSDDGGDEDENENEDGSSRPNNATTIHPLISAQIEGERFMRYRRQSTCTLLVLFFLIRLWIEALLTKDIGLIFLSMMGTLWTYRWVASRAVDDEEYERRIVADIEGHGGRGNGGGIDVGGGVGGGRGGADAAIDFDPDLGLMSFQAQLALAILESQRQMFENGGYGGNSNGNVDGPGVTNEARQAWKTHEWGVPGGDYDVPSTIGSRLPSMKRQGSGSSNYGSLGSSTIDDGHLVATPSVADDNITNNERCPVPHDDVDLAKGTGGDEPACSICLCEYERGERVVRLPCDHVYHESCLNSWTTNHTRCPLCNYDLMDGYERPVSVQEERARHHAEEQRAFRALALSALGRRVVRPRGRTSRSSRRGVGTTGVDAAAAAAAVEDSIV
jgi:hypothetical protein